MLIKGQRHFWEVSCLFLDIMMGRIMEELKYEANPSPGELDVSNYLKYLDSFATRSGMHELEHLVD